MTTFSPLNSLTRRDTLAVAGGALISSSVGSSAHAAEGLNLSNRDDLLTALAKMRGRTDGGISMGWIIGTRYAVVENLATPMWGILAGTFSRYRKISDVTYEVRSIEVAYFTDLETGQLLETWTNPFTDQEIDVPRIRMGPATIIMTADGLDIPNPVGEAAGMFIKHRFRPAVTVGDDVWITEEIQVDGPPLAPNTPKFAYNEMTTYHSTLTELADPDAASVATSVQYHSLVSWRPWMGFGDMAGHTTARGSGKHINRIEDFPKYYLELTKRYNDDVLNDPETVLNG